jgi:hypothetical protein
VSHLPWMKFAHVEFLLSPDMLGLSLQSQGALLRLMAHAARQTPYGTLPDDFDLIGRMVGKGWSKRIQQELFSGVFVATEDARWTCPLMTDVWADAPKANNDVTAEANTAKTNAQRQAEYKARQKGNATGNVTSNAENVTGNEIGNAQSNDGNVTSNAENVTGNEIGNAQSNDGNVTSNEENVTFGGIKGGDLEKDLDLDKPTPLAPLPEFKEQVDRPEKTFEQSGIKNIPDHWVTLAKTQYPDLNKNQIDLIFAKMQTVYTSQTRFMGTKVRDWSTKWKEFVIRHAPSIIAQSNQFASTQSQAAQQPEPEFVKPSAPVKRGPTPEQLAEQKRQAAEYLASLAGGAA